MKNNNNLKTVAWVVIILCVIVLTAMLATGVLKFNVKVNSFKSGAKETQEEQTTDNITANDNDKDNDNYSSIIEEYKAAMNDKEYNNINAEEKYPNINNNMIHLYHEYNDDNSATINYVFYDINKDNKNELILVSNNSTSKNRIIEIYTSNGTKTERFIKDNCLGERCSAEIYDNGIIYFYGAGGASRHGLDFYKIASDGYSKETIKSFGVEYDENKNITISSDNNVTNYKSDEEAISSVVENAKPIDLTKLNWTEIK